MLGDWLAFEETWLAPYAMRSRDSRGRRYPEEPHPFRTIFQRDRERIVHCSAFRRLMGKTQVLVAQINDHHRTRLTHTLEVTQISRTIARRLRLNEDLTEAIALSHDLGHPPFGHAGEEALDECLRDHGGFDHNLHGLRQVEELEDRYPDIPGLNLSWEVREAFAQHSSRRDAPEAREYLQSGGPLLEAQVVDVADSLAYNVHDVDDALGTGILKLEDLEEVEFWCRAAEPVRRDHPGLAGDRFRTAVVRELIAVQVADLLAETERRLRDARPASPADVRAAAPLVGFGPEVARLRAGLEQFLMERVYRHPRVRRMAARGQEYLRSLFAAYVARPELLPARHLRRRAGSPERAAGDYLAGMTDRFCRQEFLRLFQPSSEL